MDRAAATLRGSCAWTNFLASSGPPCVEVQHATTAKELRSPLVLGWSALRNPAHVDRGIRRMPTTGSDGRPKVDGMHRNEWTAWSGIAGRHKSEPVVGMDRKMHFFLLALSARDLIQNDRISPFNIAQRVRLLDFTVEQVRELVSKWRSTDEQVSSLAERIYYWTDGQPYLAQRLCSYLSPSATVADVGASIERLRQEDENHLPPVLNPLNNSEGLRVYVRQVLNGEKIKFYPHEDRRHAQLELMGLIKADTEGNCQVRNRIYRQALTEGSSQIHTRRTIKEEHQDMFQDDVFISYSEADRGWVQEYFLPQLERAGLRSIVPYRDFKIGAPKPVNIEWAVENSRHTLIVLTIDWVKDKWAEFEEILVGTVDPAARQRKLIPIMLKPCQLPLRIAMLTPADFTRPAELGEMSRLTSQILSTRVVQPLTAPADSLGSSHGTTALQPGQEHPAMQESRRSSHAGHATLYFWLLVGGATGFLTGILGNLVASWIQKDLLLDKFTPLSVISIVVLTVMGLACGAWLQRRMQM